MHMTESSFLPRTLFIEQFLPLKGRAFIADCDPKAAELQLVDVQPGRQRQGGIGVSFALLFRSNPDVLLVAGLYKIRCGNFGPEVVYIEATTPPAEGGTGYYYQSVFN